MKPRLYKFAGSWYCLSQLGLGIGRTPRGAYKDWAELCGFI